MSESKLREALHTDVVIVAEQEQEQDHGAQSAAPDHSPRAAHAAEALPARGVPGVGRHPDTQRRVEEFLYYQAELLDRKQWAAYIDLFDDQGMYWMPVTPEQTDWLDTP